MNNCYLCGEFTKVRERDILLEGIGVICELCDNAEKIIEKEMAEARSKYWKKTTEERQSKWIKERNEILK